jgi:predicted acylesterase/phospholipase RssA
MSLAMLLALVATAGCASVALRNPVPNGTLALQARLPDHPGVRSWADESPSDIKAELRRRLPSLPPLAQSATRENGRPVVEVLALSGGGSDGAFGAGVLTGWTKRGDRPQFEIVTGVSAGAIIAPFAFLGPRYDGALKEVWTEYETTELVTAQILPGLLGGAALADTAPLAALIAKYVDRRFLRAVAAEYRRGRLLLIGTTNLDAQRPVVWNMGEIAASTHADSLQLFRDVILASAAIPGAFPPVGIKVVADGKEYEEMHVDGGTTREVFVSPVNLPFKAFDALYDAPPIRRLYLLKNGKIVPEYKPVTKQTIPIAARAISTLIKTQHLNDIYRIYRMAQDGGAEFRLLAVPQSFDKQPKQAFDPEYQHALFDLGREIGAKGPGHWLTAPPVIRSSPR